MSNLEAVVSPGGVGFDINCGVRLIRTNLFYKDVINIQEKIAQSLFDHNSVGAGSFGITPPTEKELMEPLVYVITKLIKVFLS